MDSYVPVIVKGHEIGDFYSDIGRICMHFLRANVLRKGNNLSVHLQLLAINRIEDVLYSWFGDQFRRKKTVYTNETTL